MVLGEHDGDFPAHDGDFPAHDGDLTERDGVVIERDGDLGEEHGDPLRHYLRRLVSLPVRRLICVNASGAALPQYTPRAMPPVTRLVAGWP